MPTASAPIRIDDEIDTAARSAARRMSRSVAEQVSHWARLGRELERSPDVSVARVRSVLSGRRSYDALSAPEQAIVRTHWQADIERRLASLDLAHAFAQRGHGYAELNDQGQVIETAPPLPVAPAAHNKRTRRA